MESWGFQDHGTRTTNGQQQGSLREAVMVYRQPGQGAPVSSGGLPRLIFFGGFQKFNLVYLERNGGRITEKVGCLTRKLVLCDINQR